jgi:hypothetical protein
MRMLYWPLRSPTSAAKRLPGNAARSLSDVATSTRSSFSRADRSNPENALTSLPARSLWFSCPDSCDGGLHLLRQVVSVTPGSARTENECAPTRLTPYLRIDAKIDCADVWSNIRLGENLRPQNRSAASNSGGRAFSGRWRIGARLDLGQREEQP